MSTEDQDSDDFDVLFVNCCAEFVTRKRLEIFPQTLVREHAAGEWVLVAELCKSLSIEATADLPFDELPWLFATWLASPDGDDDFAMILFYDWDRIRSFPAMINLRHFLRE